MRCLDLILRRMGKLGLENIYIDVQPLVTRGTPHGRSEARRGVLALESRVTQCLARRIATEVTSLGMNGQAIPKKPGTTLDAMRYLRPSKKQRTPHLWGCLCPMHPHH